MLKNYFKVAWRNLINNKTYSSINIIGLSFGMTVALMIGLWVWDEVSFNTYHRNHERLAEILSIQTANGNISTDRFAAVPLAKELRDKYPGDFKSVSLISKSSHLLVVGGKKIREWGFWAESAFPTMFSLKMIKGNAEAFRDPSSIILNESLAKTLFGDDEPMNKTVQLDNKTVLKVAGVYEDLPLNTDLAGTSFLLAWENKDNPANGSDADWNDHHFELFVQLSDHADFASTARKIKDVTKPHVKGGYEEIGLHPMNKWHLYNEFSNGSISGGRIQFVWLFGLIGIFVLLLACINFMNLSTARSERRAKEVGIRKAIGSLRIQLAGQFLSESLIMSLMALIIAIIFLVIMFPLFNELAGKRMSIPWTNPLFWIMMLFFTVFTGVVAGSYPAFYLSGFDPVEVLKGTFKAGRWTSLPRRILIVAQFTVSVTLIIGTIIVLKQVQFARSRPVGYSREGLITINMTTPEMRTHYEAIRNDLLQTGVVENVAESSSPSTGVENSMLGYDWNGRDPHSVPIIGTLFVSHDFGKTLGWEIKEGRDFSRAFPTDSGAFILNEAAVKFTGLKKPVGEVIKWNQKQHMIVGVVKDMVMESPYMPVQPTFFTLLDNKRIHVITVRIKPTVPVNSALAQIEPIFRKYDAGNSFEYQFTDDAYGRKFSAEEHIGNLTSCFALLAIFITCLGLFGLATFVATQRTKEIGIRKILGASVFNLWNMLTKEFVTLVLFSLFLSIPLANYFLHQWLQRYAYHITISLWVYAAVGGGALVIAILTVSFQTIKAALINPVKNLRAE